MFCRINKFRKNNYKWVVVSAKSFRVIRRVFSFRFVLENVSKIFFGIVERVDKS